MNSPPKPPRRILGLFRKSEDAAVWQPAGQRYPRLGDAAAAGAKGGVYAVWHGGVRPQWLRVGAAPNLAAAFARMAEAPAFAPFVPAGIYAAWSFPEAAEYAGVVRSLAAAFAPALQDEACAWELALDPAAAAIAYPFPPGTSDG